MRFNSAVLLHVSISENVLQIFKMKLEETDLISATNLSVCFKKRQHIKNTYLSDMYF